MVSFGDSKHETVKLPHRLLDVTPLKLALSAKCTIHDVVRSYFSFSPGGQDILFDKFWSCGWFFARLGNPPAERAGMYGFSACLCDARRQVGYSFVNSFAINSACFNTVSVASFCISGG